MNTIDLLIVGAGPVGLTLAVEAARHGISFRIIDKAPLPSDRSKALAIWSGTQEALAAMGVIDSFLAHGIKIHGVCLCDAGRPLGRNDVTEGVESLYPRPIIVPQSETERLLAEKLSTEGHSVERAMELTSLSAQKDGVECLLRRGDDEEEKVFARYVAACDGARSVVRKSFDVEFPGITEDINFVLVDCAIDGGDLRADEITITWNDKGGIAFFPVVKDVWRIFAQRKGSSDTSDPTLEEMQHNVDQFFPGRGAKLRDPKWLSFFRINERVAAQFSLGRVFLLGDAAHIHSPAGGQGMNTGMQDAFNLAWKLDLLLKGIGNADILSQSYQAERHPVAEAVVKGATQKLHMGMATGMPIRILKDLAVPLLMHVSAFRKNLARELSELRIHYSGPLIGASTAWPATVAGFAPGTRPRDVVLKDSNGQTVSLWQRFLHKGHTLLIFSGENPQERDGVAKDLIALCEETGKRIVPLFISHGEALPSFKGCECLIDPTGEAHRRYGAKKSAWYLIRPDQYAATRCQPAEIGPLRDYITKVLKA